MKKRDVSIEFIRIVGSIIVVSLHCLCIFNTTKNIIYFFKAFLCNGVPLFYLIMGYFLFEDSNKRYLERLLSVIKKIVVPAFIVMLFTELLLDYLNSQNTFLAVITNPQIDWKNWLKGILKWQCARQEYEHLWYVFSYLQMMICFPLIRYVCSEEKDKTRVRRALIALLILRRLSVELQHLFWGETYLNIYVPLSDLSIAYLLLGYEFQHYFEKVGKYRKANYFIVFILSNLGIWVLNGLDMRRNDVENFYHSAGSVGIILSSCMLFILIKKCNFYKSEKISNIIFFVSSKTFGIYLIHYMIIRKIKSTGIIKILQWNTLLEYILTIVGVYTVSLLAVSIWGIIRKQVKFIWNSIQGSIK